MLPEECSSYCVDSFDSLPDLFSFSAVMSAVYTKINGLNVGPYGTPVSDVDHSSTCVFTRFLC